MPSRRYVEEIGLAAMLATKRLAGVALEVNLRQHVTPSANKAAPSGFDMQRRHQQKSKVGLSVAPQKGLMSSKIFLRKMHEFHQ